MKDIIYALQLGIEIIGIFVLCIILGIKLDQYFHSRPLFVMIMILVAFFYTMKLLLGVYKRE